MRSPEMLVGVLVMIATFLLVLVASPHSFALAWAEGWIAAIISFIVYGCVLWRTKERRY